MFRLTRQVRLAVVPRAPAPPDIVRNGYAGFPPLAGFERFITVDVTLAGHPDSASGYLVNIKQIDEAVRRAGLPILQELAEQSSRSPAAASQGLFDRFRQFWPQLDQLVLNFSPFTGFSILAREYPMVRFHHKFEFSAGHRLHNPELSSEENKELFGKCNNPNGHGHNYELQVSLRGSLIPIAALEELVVSHVIQKFDHKFLNRDTLEFKTMNPTVENIAQIIFRLLRDPLQSAGAELAAVTVWETPKTWCEYWE